MSDLLELSEQALLEPSLIIAHASRCGSTLLARLAGLADGAPLLLEPGLLSRPPSHNEAGSFDRPDKIVLAEAVRALTGRSDRPCILKLSSRSTRLLPELRRAFPKTPIIWLQRRPMEIVESNLSKPPGRRFHAMPDRERGEWVLRRVTLGFIAAKAYVDEHVHVLDYSDFPDTAWTRLADIMGFDANEKRPQMQEVMGRDSRTGEPYRPRAPQKLSGEIEQRVRDTLVPLYDALALRRRA